MSLKSRRAMGRERIPSRATLATGGEKRRKEEDGRRERKIKGPGMVKLVSYGIVKRRVF